MNDLSSIANLDELWNYTNRLHKQHYPESTLEPIMAGGKVHKPKYMFVFINPTYRNVSSDSAWEGRRRPWTGTRYIWKIFNDAGHFDDDLLEEIKKRRAWDIEFADKVYNHLENRGFYFTNIVKWTGENADLPDTNKTKLFLPILLREIEIVQPEYIITFGLIPFYALVDEKIKLGKYFDYVLKTGHLKYFPININNTVYKILPSYFPVGRGSPKRAAKILSMLPQVTEDQH